jgi:hypothetical protein
VRMFQDAFGPSDFDREVQKHLDRYERQYAKAEREKKKGERQ